MSCNVGDTRRCSCAFANIAGDAADPTTVTLEIKSPAGTTTSYTYAGADITKDSTGNYHYDLLLDAPFTWYYYWVGTGAVAQADQGSIQVEQKNTG